MRLSKRFHKDDVFKHLLLSATITLAIISVFYTYSIVSKANNSEKQESIYVNDTFSCPIDDISSLLDHSVTGFVYVGRDSCPECLIFNWVMQNEILKQFPTLAIQKFDTSIWTEHEQYRTVLDMFGITSIPTVLFLRDDGTYEIILMENMTGQEIVQRIASLIEQENMDK